MLLVAILFCAFWWTSQIPAVRFSMVTSLGFNRSGGGDQLRIYYRACPSHTNRALIALRGFMILCFVVFHKSSRRSSTPNKTSPTPNINAQTNQIQKMATTTLWVVAQSTNGREHTPNTNTKQCARGIVANNDDTDAAATVATTQKARKFTRACTCLCKYSRLVGVVI